MRTPVPGATSDADASALDELTVLVEPVLETRMCPRSGMPFKDRSLTLERIATCPCGAQVALLASPDGGPGGVYADHELELSQ